MCDKRLDDIKLKSDLSSYCDNRATIDIIRHRRITSGPFIASMTREAGSPFSSNWVMA
jgi:hypothetical protein